MNIRELSQTFITCIVASALGTASVIYANQLREENQKHLTQAELAAKAAECLAWSPDVAHSVEAEFAASEQKVVTYDRIYPFARSVSITEHGRCVGQTHGGALLVPHLPRDTADAAEVVMPDDSAHYLLVKMPDLNDHLVRYVGFAVPGEIYRMGSR